MAKRGTEAEDALGAPAASPPRGRRAARATPLGIDQFERRVKGWITRPR